MNVMILNEYKNRRNENRTKINIEIYTNKMQYGRIKIRSYKLNYIFINYILSY